MLEVEDTGLVAADSLDRAEEAAHSLAGAGCNSLAEGTAAFAVCWSTFALSSRTAGLPAATQSLSRANDGGSTGNRRNNNKPRWI